MSQTIKMKEAVRRYASSRRRALMTASLKIKEKEKEKVNEHFERA